jgi:hypothetical protein
MNNFSTLCDRGWSGLAEKQDRPQSSWRRLLEGDVVGRSLHNYSGNIEVGGGPLRAPQPAVELLLGQPLVELVARAQLFQHAVQLGQVGGRRQRQPRELTEYLRAVAQRLAEGEPAVVPDVSAAAAALFGGFFLGGAGKEDGFLVFFLLVEAGHGRFQAAGRGAVQRCRRRTAA